MTLEYELRVAKVEVTDARPHDGIYAAYKETNVLTVRMTEEEFQALRLEVLKAWEPKKDHP